MTDKYCGYITFRMDDSKLGKVITLGTAAFSSEDKLQRNWKMVENTSGYSTFVADLQDAAGRTLLDKSVDHDTIVSFLRKPISSLIGEARESR